MAIEKSEQKPTFIAPTIIMIDIKIVMHKLNAMIILTINGGRVSIRIVFGLKRRTNIAMIKRIDSKIAPTPAIIEPVRNDWRQMHVLKIGLAIFECVWVFSLTG